MRVFRSLHTYTPGTMEGWLHRITTNLFLDQARRKQRIRFDALSDEAAGRLPSALPDPRRGPAGPDVRRRHRGRAGLARPRLPRRGRAVRRRGPQLRGDRRRARPQARHRPLAHPPRSRPAAHRPRPPRPARRAHPLRRPLVGPALPDRCGDAVPERSHRQQGLCPGRRPAPPCRGGAGLVARPHLPRAAVASSSTRAGPSASSARCAAPSTIDPPPQLLGSLYAVDAWAAVDEIEKRSRRRRTTVVLVGGGAVGACVLGLVTVTGGPTGRGDVPTRPSPATIRGELSHGPGRVTDRC